MEKFDAVVIGAGNGGLLSALELQKNGKKVLLLEKGDKPGGISTSFQRGRFEFDANPHFFTHYGTKENPGELYSLFETLNLNSKIEMTTCEDIFHLHVLNPEEHYIFPMTEEAFIDQMEEYVKGSKEAMVTFFGLCEDVKDAFSDFPKEKPSDMESFYQRYPNFVELAPYKVLHVLEKIHMPKKAIELLSSFAIFFGSFIDDISFVHFALLVHSYVHYGFSAAKNTSFSVSLTLEQEFLRLGGVVRYHSCVEEIKVQDQAVVGVKTKDEEYETKRVIADISPNVVYGKLIRKENVPSFACQLQNERILGPRLFTVSLGLSLPTKQKTPTVYVVLPTLNQKVLKKNRLALFPNVLLGSVQNYENDSTILQLSSFFFQDSFDKLVKKESYYEAKNELARLLVTTWEKATKSDVHSYIEEMEIITPVTYARYTGHPDGTTFGYLAKGYDNLLPRMFTEKKETQIQGLSFCGAFGSYLASSAATYFSGAKTGKEV